MIGQKKLKEASGEDDFMMDCAASQRRERMASPARTRRSIAEAYDVMRRTLAYALFALGAGCSGKALDLGGVPGPSLDGSPSGDGSILGSWPVTDQRNPRSLRSEGPHLYWIADRAAGCAIVRCDKNDCAKTLVPVVQVESAGLWGIEVRRDVLYAADSTSIFSCSTIGCSKLRVVVADAEASAVAFDDINVYWSRRGKSAIYSCSLDAACQQINVVEGSDRTDAVELAVNEATLYWIQTEDAYPQNPGSVRTVAKDGSGAWATFAGVQNQAASLAVRNGFVYWATSFSLGTIARCPSAGCSGGPEILARSQYFPHFVDPAGDMIFWMNGSTLPEDPRSVEVLGCRAADCTATLEVLDQGLGASIGARSRTFPSRELVVDDDAIYWIGDIVNVAPMVDGGVAVVGSIRRTARRRAR